MKKLNKIILMTLIFILTYGSFVYASDKERLENILRDGGVDKSCTENIINYVENSDINIEELNRAISLTKGTVKLIDGRVNIIQFNLNELHCIYNNIKTISDILEITIYVNFLDGKLLITNDNNSDVLFEGQLKYINKYYGMYERLISNEDFIKRMILKPGE